MYNDIKNLLPDNILFFDEPLKKHSTFRIGGSADLLVAPQTEEQLEVLFKYIKDNAVRYVVIGNGSNLLFRDEGFRGIVVKLGSEFSGISASECAGGMLLSAKAGTLLSKLAFFAAENSLTGLEFAAGIPGNVCGAVLMNAGASLYIGGKADSYADGIKLAAKIIDSGKAMETLEKFIEVSNREEEKTA